MVSDLRPRNSERHFSNDVALRAEHRASYASGEMTDCERLLLLTEFNGILIGSLDYERSAARLMELLVPALGDCCALEIEGSAAASPLALVHAAPQYRRRVDELCARNPSDPFALATDAPAGSGIARPLAARGRRFGTITLVRFRDRTPYSLQEISFAENLIDQLALAVDNARIYQDAQQAIQVREELLAIVSHDLRNPLSVIAGTVTNMLRALPSDAPSRQRAQMDRLNRATKIMDGLVHLLLDQVAIQTGRFSLTMRRVEPSALLNDITEMFQAIAAERRIRLDVRIDSDQDLAFVGDRDRLAQVLSNLVGNAMKFTPTNGCVTLECASVRESVVFSITDTGCGIAEEHLGRIFDRHWHVSRKNNGGTGLGLFIARGIVEAHGGSISAKSIVDGGTTITFVVPRNSTQP